MLTVNNAPEQNLNELSRMLSKLGFEAKLVQHLVDRVVINNNKYSIVFSINDEKLRCESVVSRISDDFEKTSFFDSFLALNASRKMSKLQIVQINKEQIILLTSEENLETFDENYLFNLLQEFDSFYQYEFEILVNLTRKLNLYFDGNMVDRLQFLQKFLLLDGDSTTDAPPPPPKEKPKE